MNFRCLLFCLVLFAPSFSSAESLEHDLRYRSAEERLEQRGPYGLKDWLGVGALLELEGTVDWDNAFGDAPSSKESDRYFVLLTKFEITPLNWLSAEIIYEYDGEEHRHLLDEALVSLEINEAFNLDLGRTYLPFGEYYSHFIEGPLVEFGETRADVAILSIAANEAMEFSLFLYDGSAHEFDSSSDINLDFGYAVLIDVLPELSFGTGFLSDLADSDQDFLTATSGQYDRKVGALNANITYHGDSFDLSLEGVIATKTFLELESTSDRPSAWNLEYAYTFENAAQLSCRLEGSNEIEEAAKLRFGIGGTWWLTDHLSISLEYFRSKFRRGFQTDFRDNDIRSRDELGVSFAIVGF